MIDKRKPARMARLVARWRRSGESGAGFARRHDVHPWTFWYWCRKLSTEPPLASATGSKPAGFVPVQMTVEADAPVVEIVFRGGDRLQVRGAASADLVRSVVVAMRSAC
jgi:transposase-like protein